MKRSGRPDSGCSQRLFEAAREPTPSVSRRRAATTFIASRCSGEAVLTRSPGWSKLSGACGSPRDATTAALLGAVAGREDARRPLVVRSFDPAPVHREAD